MQTFRPADFLRRLGEKLVGEFADAAVAGTPGLVGSAREHPARKQLERLLPSSTGVGSGIIIDSFGRRSRQQDIVLYEKALCPVFAVNDTPEATFYPIEGVIAVGEVKSGLDGTQLQDCFEKSWSVQALRRFSRATSELEGLPPTHAYRPYGSSMSLAAVEKDQYDQLSRFADRPFCFVLCRLLELKIDNILSRASNLWSVNPDMPGPTVIVSLEDGFLQRISGTKLYDSPQPESSAALLGPASEAFPGLIRKLQWYTHHGRTVPIEAYQRYFSNDTERAEAYEIIARSSF